MNLAELLETVGIGRATGSLVLVLVLLLFRHLFNRRVLALESLSNTERRQWLVRIRTVLLFALLGGLVVIWADQLRSFSLTLMAFAVAAVIATKEFIMCLGGAIHRASAQSFHVGDRIEIKGIRGWVVDHTLLATKLLEIGPGAGSQIQTGRCITLPNSVFLTEAVTNETYLDDHVFHLIVVPLKSAQDWEAARDRLHAIAAEECAPFIEHMEQRVKRLSAESGITLPSVEPRVAVRLPDPERIDLIARVPVPAARRGAIEQRILTRFLQATRPEASS